MANTLIKNVLCQEDTLDPDGFNRNQVKVLLCSLIAYNSACVLKILSWAKTDLRINYLAVWFAICIACKNLFGQRSAS